MTRTNNEMLELFESALAQLRMPEEPELLYMPIIYSMSGGGKRLRPVLLLLSAEVFGGSAEEAMPAALAVEIFHNFTLLHDDIMDNADVRRGKPSVYAKWGGNVALLSGDAMLITAYKYLSRIPSAVLPRVMNIFTDMALEVCEGQQYDMDFETMSKVSVEEYMQMIERKTSALLSGSAMIGATMAGASEEDIKKIYRFATELGLALQLQDVVVVPVLLGVEFVGAAKIRSHSRGVLLGLCVKPHVVVYGGIIGIEGVAELYYGFGLFYLL